MKLVRVYSGQETERLDLLQGSFLLLEAYCQCGSLDWKHYIYSYDKLVFQFLSIFIIQNFLATILLILIGIHFQPEKVLCVIQDSSMVIYLGKHRMGQETKLALCLLFQLYRLIQDWTQKYWFPSSNRFGKLWYRHSINAIVDAQRACICLEVS